MGQQKHFIIGAGPAALAAAQAIRNIDRTALITMVSREEAFPYSPAVLPYLLSEELNEKDLFTKGEKILESSNIRLLRGKEVTEILPHAHEVQYQNGEREGYDKLLIATGASPQVPTTINLSADDIYTFRTYRDFVRLHKTLDRKLEIAIYGAGLVAVEAAEKLSLAGHSVTMIARSSLLRKYFRPETVKSLTQIFDDHGVQIITQSHLVSATKSQDKLQLFLSQGQTVTADRLIVATGVTPNLLGCDNLTLVEGGFKVGRSLETELPDVYAAGDVASAPSFLDGLNGPCPILPEAIVQGSVAGSNMAGEKVEYRGWIPGNCLRCFDEAIFSIGVTGLETQTGCEQLESRNGKSSLRLLFRDGCLVGAEGLNVQPIHPGVYFYLIREKVPVQKYKELLLSKPRETACRLMLQHRKTQEL